MSLHQTFSPTSSAGHADNRIFGLDLLRAIAILLVLVSHWLCHFGFWFNVQVPESADILGDIGVEIFFALSGFLIGHILIGIVRKRPAWSDFTNFALRRGMRTLPLYFLWLAVLLAAFPPGGGLAHTAVRYATLTQNLLTPFPTNYFFAVTWSLTVEVWFYLIFGFAVIALARRWGGTRALALCLTTFLVLPLATRLLWHDRGSIAFMRIDEIAYGVVIAWLRERGHGLFRHPWAPLAIGLTLNMMALCGWVPLPQRLVVPLTSNLEVIGWALCLPAALRLVSVARWFEVPVRWMASRSYALYIMHLTVLVDIAEQRLFQGGLLPPLTCVVVAILVPFPLAELSYRWVETPMLRRRPARRRSTVAPSRLGIGPLEPAG